MKQRLWEHANHYYVQALSLEPNDLAIQTNLGICYLMMNDHQKASDALDQALNLNPVSSLVHFNRGVLYQNLGKQDMAEREFGIVIDRDSNDSGALLKRADARGKQMIWKDAILDYRMHLSTADI